MNQNISSNNIIAQTHLLTDTHTPRLFDTRTDNASIPSEQPAELVPDTQPLTESHTESLTTDDEETSVVSPHPDNIPQTNLDIPHTPSALSGPTDADNPPSTTDETLAPASPPDESPTGVQLTLDLAHSTLTFTPPTTELPSDNLSPDNNNNHIPGNIAFATGMPADSLENLTHLQAGLHHYFYPRCEAADLEVLTFCLHHLFKSISRLYEELLPELALCRERQSAPSQQGRAILTVYCTWTGLHLLSGLLARIESLGHLLVSALLNMLDALDVTCLPHHNTLTSKAALETRPADLPSSEQWLQATQNIRGRLQDWEQDWHQRLSFRAQFHHLPALQRELAVLDSSTEHILAHTRVIFGELLPALRDLQPDTEVATALLFDLAQQVDQIQLAATAQQEPLLPLLQEHAQCSLV